MSLLKPKTWGRKKTPVRNTTLIRSSSSQQEVINMLIDQGCRDVTNDLADSSSLLKLPVNGGGLGDIYQGALKDGTQVAMKCMRLYTSSSNNFLKRLAREIYAWSRCSHHNVLPLIGFAQIQDQLAMISPWMESGTLPSYLQKNPKANRYKFCSQVIEGLEYLHTQHVVHGDLKGNNLLMAADGIVKLIDFGSTEIDSQLVVFTPDPDYATPTIRWAAPELIAGTNACSPATDIYALAMTILEIITGDIPFSNIRSDTGVITRVLVKQEFPARPMHVPVTASGDMLWDLLVACWRHEPSARPGVVGMKLEFERIRPALEIIIPPIPKLNSPRTTPPPNQEDANPNRISQTMSFTQIMDMLAKAGCTDLTSELVLDRCSEAPAQGGGSADIFQGELRDGTLVAIKRSRVDVQRGHIKHDPAKIRDAAKEIYIWSRCDHENIMKVLGLAIFRERITVITPWMGSSSALPDYISIIPKIDRSRLCNGIAAGLVYLHDKNIIHGDLNGRNVVIDLNGVARIIDFGASIITGDPVGFSEPTKTHLQKSRWAPPEIINNTGAGGSSYPGDVYSLGMTILEVITGEEPFAGWRDMRVMTNVMLHGAIPERSECCIPTKNEQGDALWSLLLECWSFYASARPTAAEVQERLAKIYMDPAKLVPGNHGGRLEPMETAICRICAPPFDWSTVE